MIYLIMTVAGFSYTLFRVWIPGVPRKLAIFSYGMMAPYQTYRTFNEELIAEGRTSEGDWERINLDPYLPFIRGEKAHRSYLVSFRYGGHDIDTKYEEYAQKLKNLEADRGREWERVRLTLEKWWMSPTGYEYLRREPFLTHNNVF
tara:strand:- start:127 stop:564 length:438 start_codon:yes stop_codon:yes gene_type:complete